MSFSHWTFIIEIATRYVGWFSLDLSPKVFLISKTYANSCFVLGTLTYLVVFTDSRLDIEMSFQNCLLILKPYISLKISLYQN